MGAAVVRERNVLVRNRLMARRSAVIWTAAVVALVLSVSACSQKKSTTGAASGPWTTGAAVTSAPPTTSADVGPAVLTISTAKGAVGVSPVTPVKVAVAGGALSSVSLTNAA